MKSLITLSLATLVLTFLAAGPAVGQRKEVRTDTVIQFPCCERAGLVTYLDISTGLATPIDALWKVNGGSAYTTPPYAGWAAPQGSAKWIQPVASPNPNPNVAAGTYTYAVQFNIPECRVPSDVRLDGSFAADNGAKVTLDGKPITSCPMPNCFKAPSQTLEIASIGPGTHTLTFEVKNESGPSGLMVFAILTRDCKIKR